jgi:hypothetical protein
MDDPRAWAAASQDVQARGDVVMYREDQAAFVAQVEQLTVPA